MGNSILKILYNFVEAQQAFAVEKNTTFPFTGIICVYGGI